MLLCDTKTTGTQGYVHWFDIAVYCMWQVIWLLMLTWNMYHEMRALVSLSVTNYFTSSWAYLEMLNFMISMAAVGLHMTRIILVDNYIDQLEEGKFSTFISFAKPRMIDMVCTLLFYPLSVCLITSV